MRLPPHLQMCFGCPPPPPSAVASLALCITDGAVLGKHPLNREKPRPSPAGLPRRMGVLPPPAPAHAVHLDRPTVMLRRNVPRLLLPSPSYFRPCWVMSATCLRTGKDEVPQPSGGLCLAGSGCSSPSRCSGSAHREERGARRQSETLARSCCTAPSARLPARKDRRNWFTISGRAQHQPLQRQEQNTTPSADGA